MAIVKQESNEDDVDQEEVAEMYGYNNLEETSHNDPESSQVLLKNNSDKPQDHNFRNEETCGYIQPCESQIVTVFTNPDNTVPFHIELDSGATISYIREYKARKHNKYPEKPVQFFSCCNVCKTIYGCRLKICCYHIHCLQSTNYLSIFHPSSKNFFHF